MAGRDKVSMTLSITKEDRRALKQIALDRDTTVSALLQEWMRAYLAQAEQAKQEP